MSSAPVPIRNDFRGYAYRSAGIILDGGRTTDAEADQSAALYYRSDLKRLRLQDDAGNFHTVAVTDGTDFDYAEVGDLAAVGAAAAAGSSSEIPRADHVHALAADATMLATVADNNLTGGVQVTHKFVVVDGASGNTDFVLAEKFEILSVLFVKAGGAGAASNTAKLHNLGSTTDITNAADLNVADKVAVRVSTVDDAANVIAAGGTLRITTVRSGGNNAFIAHVTGIRRA